MLDLYDQIEAAAAAIQAQYKETPHAGIILGTLIWLTVSTYGLFWAIPLIVVQGYFVAFLFMVVHETAHKTAFRSRAINLVLGHLSSFAIGLPWPTNPGDRSWRGRAARQKFSVAQVVAGVALIAQGNVTTGITRSST